MAKLGDSGVLVAFVLSVLVHIRCQVSVRMHTASTNTVVAATVDLLQLADLCWAACQGSWACKNYCLYNDCGKHRVRTGQPTRLGRWSHRSLQKFSPQDGGLPELIVARSCLTNHSEAASLWLVKPKQQQQQQQAGCRRLQMTSWMTCRLL